MTGLHKSIEARGGKNLDSSRFCYKLQEGHYALDVATAEGCEVDEARMAVAWPFADGNRRDNTGDLLEVEGISLERHRKNPFTLYDHGKEITLPIAMAQDPDDQSYCVYLDPVAKQGRVKGFFYDGKGTNNYRLGMTREMAEARASKVGGMSKHALFCEQLFDLMARGFVRGGSIGYLILDGYELPPDVRSTGSPGGVHLVKTLMLEASAVVMSAHMDTVRKSLESGYRVCGQPLSGYLVKSLGKLGPPRKTQLGWASHLYTKH